ncbi:DUF3099 domain-containing protein [Cellulomonas sp. Marseille-Q8402]
MSRKSPDPAQSITSAPEPLAADQARRARRYLIQMGIRVVCFLLAALLWQHVPLWVGLTLIVGAVVLPYIAVLFANAGRERQSLAPPYAVLPPELDAAPPARPDLTQDAPGRPSPTDDPPTGGTR